MDFIPGLTGLLDLKIQYPEYYSAWLQNQVHGSTGVGGSIWGESYSMMGYIGIIVFTIIWLLFIRRSNKHLDYHVGHSYFVAALGTHFAWYINRLDFNRVAQACKVIFLCFAIWAVIYMFFGGVIRIGKLYIRIGKQYSSNKMIAPNIREL